MGCASVCILMLLDLDIAEDEVAELEPVAAALQRLTGGQCVVLVCLLGGLQYCFYCSTRNSCLLAASDEAAELKPVAAALQQLTGVQWAVFVSLF
jgi:hypothetical protein